MRVLISGGAGYIGSVTVERLIAHGASAVVFDNLYQGHRAAVHPAAVFIEGCCVLGLFPFVAAFLSPGTP